jgi:transcriptional regulator with XRE-family HTH domain
LTLAERLRELRRERQLTQKQLQTLSGVPFVTISRIETGRTTEITTRTLVALAGVFNVTTDYLLGLSDVRS